MNKLYLFDSGRALFAPDKPLTRDLAKALQEAWKESAPSASHRWPLTIMGEPLEVIDLRTPPPTVDVVELAP